MLKKQTIIKISGMTCASCSNNIEREILKLPGIISASVNFASKKALIEYDTGTVNEEKIRAVIKKTGYGVAYEKYAPADSSHIQMMDGNHHHEEGDPEKNWRGFLLSAILSLPLFLEMFFEIESGIIFLGSDFFMWLNLILGTGVVMVLGWRFHKMAAYQLRHGRANMDSLISLGTLAAYFYSVWAILNGQTGYLEISAAIITLILLGKYFEAKSLGRAGEAMKKLMELGVKKARVISDGKEQEIEIEKVLRGDLILIKPGEKIPLDAKIIYGEGSVDESMLTGESMPSEKKVGSKIFAATLNLNGIIKAQVTEPSGSTMLSQIIETVERAQQSKAPIQKLADKISGIFVPIVILLAIITFFGWLYLTGNISLAIINAVAVLVIACPCALGLATPTAIMAGTGRGARNGILFKSGESFEKAKNISMVVFDKTGTLTLGAPKVRKIIMNPGGSLTEQEIIQLAAALAKNSNHPLSRAIANYAQEKNINPAKLENFREIRGKGMVAHAEKGDIVLGNLLLLGDRKIRAGWADKLLANNDFKTGTAIFIACDGAVMGAVILSDKIRPEAFEVVVQIKAMGLKVAMITGDNKKTAEFVGRELGIEKIIAEVLPNEKSDEIKKLQANGENVIFVGDGINDAPSLVQADLGIAIGSASDIAKEAGQILLLESNLKKVIEAIKISRLTFKSIRQNLFWAFAYNIIAIPLAGLGILNPAISAAAMAMSSVSVVLNSLRIYKK